MDRTSSLFLILKGVLVVGLTGVGLFFLSSLGGLQGIVLGFAFLYMALFTSMAFQVQVHRVDRPWEKILSRS